MRRSPSWLTATLLLLLAGCNALPEVVAQVDTTPPTAEPVTDDCVLGTGETLPPAPTLAQAPPMLRAPVTLESIDGTLETDLYVQFSKTELPGATGPCGGALGTIWTRAYGLTPVRAGQPLPALDIPGPTFVYHPGDLLDITLHNQLNGAFDPMLKEFEAEVAALSSQDDIATPIPHEINIPHNADNTNLHVHGMHVDPKQDDVTLIILPEDDNPSNYTPMLQHYVPDINAWWRWRYAYRLPADHLPGSHWYHDHKHGATSTHVENGMAGALVVRPRNPENDVVPGLPEAHDRVLVVQEIANYGAQQGNASGRGRMTVERQDQNTDLTSLDWPEITVNGQHQPNLVVERNRTERWRIVTAGSNHRSLSFYWLAKVTAPETMNPALYTALEGIRSFEDACPYIVVGTLSQCPGSPTAAKKLPASFDVTVTPFDGDVKLVALDGITLSEAIDVTPTTPVAVGPGNRADLIVRPSAEASGTYMLVKNYDTPPPMYSLIDEDYGSLFSDPTAGYWRYTVLMSAATDANTPATQTVPGPGVGSMAAFGNVSGDPYGLQPNRQGKNAGQHVFWPAAVDSVGALQLGTNSDGDSVFVAQTNVAPLLVGAPHALSGGGEGVDVAMAGKLDDDGNPTGVGWGIIAGGSGVADTQVLMTIEVPETPPVPTGPDNPAPPDATWLTQISPTGSGSRLMKSPNDVPSDVATLEPGIPAYVSPISDADVVGRQVIVFDKSGIDFAYIDRNAAQDSVGTTTIHQFSLNGRQFDLNDYVGNLMANDLIDDPVPHAVPNVFDDDLLGRYVFNGEGQFTNQVTIDDVPRAYYTNPGYYLPITTGTTETAPDQPAEVTYYTFDYDAATAPPTYAQITGLEEPRQPVARTAEEWVLINNSRTVHPFHIHISPLFLTEVGQLSFSYDSTASPKQRWELKKLAEDDPIGYALNNWWDVVNIPPNGYVKFRTWFNIPNQYPADQTDPDSPVTVEENANVFGSWVYHCHVLRHEDRGMMMVVNVRPNTTDGRDDHGAH